MSNYRSAFTVILKATGVTLLLYFLLQMLIGLLAVNGTLPENRLVPVQAVSMALAVLPGGMYAARKAGLGALPSALLTALCLCVVLLLLGFLLFDGLSCSVASGLLLLGAVVGSLLAGAAGRNGKKRKQRRRVPVRK